MKSKHMQKNIILLSALLLFFPIAMAEDEGDQAVSVTISPSCEVEDLTAVSETYAPNLITSGSNHSLTIEASATFNEQTGTSLTIADIDTLSSGSNTIDLTGVTPSSSVDTGTTGTIFTKTRTVTYSIPDAALRVPAGEYTATITVTCKTSEDE